jgi:uncharacterized membrane protein YdfJ with MMPL/SSD domain
VIPGRLSQEFSFPGQEGYQANVAILEAYGDGGPGNPLVPVVTLPAGTTVDSPGAADTLDRAFAGVAADPRLRVLAAPATTDDRRLVADGGRTVYGLVWGPYQGPDGADPALAQALGDGLRRALPAGAEVQVTGLDALREAAAEEPAGTGVLVETLAGGLGALVVLAFVFGSLLALVPLLIAAVAILTTFLAILGLTGLVEVSFIVQFLVALIGLGVAVDYSLLVVTRWREELAAGHDRSQAVQRAMATAGRAVVTSGGTVAVGLLALVLLPVPFLRSIGYAGLLIPLAATLATLTLLARAFRSLLLALKAIVLNLLSIGAAYGVLVLVWQDGHGSEAVWGIPATGAIAMWVPLMGFAFLYGLSMDYEVFLLARTREEYDATGSTPTAVVQGLGRVGRLVTSAALILFLAFASMASVPELDVRIMATALGAGILIDATILRALLVPALVALLGRWNWWLPRWAARPLRVPPSDPAPEPPRPRSGPAQAYETFEVG